MGTLIKKTILIGILIILCIAMLPWGVISSHYNKYCATKEPGEYSQCANRNCRRWKHHNDMRRLKEGWFCEDSCVVWEQWQITEDGKEEYIGIWKPE